MTFDEFWNGQDRRFQNRNFRSDLLAVWVAAANAEREACGEIAHIRSLRCSAMADDAEDKDEEINLRSLSWQFAVLAAEIRQKDE